MATDPTAHVREPSEAEPSSPSLSQRMVPVAKSRWTHIVAAFVGVAAAVLVWTTSLSNDPLASKRQELAAKDVRTKNRIRENAKVFNALSQSEKDQIRDVSAHFESKSEADLKRTEGALGDYKQFLTSLSSTDREAVRKAATPEAMIGQVEAILDQRDQKTSPTMSAKEFMEQRHMGGLSIPPSRFAELTEIIERRAGIEPDEARSPLLRLAEALLPLSSQGNGPERGKQFFAPIAVEIIVLKRPGSEDAPIPDYLRESRPDSRTMNAALVTFASLDAEYQRLRRQQSFSDDELNQAFLDHPELSDELLSLSSAEFRSELAKVIIFDQIRDERTTLTAHEFRRLPSSFHEMRRIMSRLMPELFAPGRGRGSFGGPRGPGGPRPGGGNGLSPGRRPEPGRGGDFDRRPPFPREGENGRGGGRFRGDRQGGGPPPPNE